MNKKLISILLMIFVLLILSVSSVSAADDNINTVSINDMEYNTTTTINFTDNSYSLNPTINVNSIYNNQSPVIGKVNGTVSYLNGTIIENFNGDLINGSYSYKINKILPVGKYNVTTNIYDTTIESKQIGYASELMSINPYNITINVTVPEKTRVLDTFDIVIKGFNSYTTGSLVFIAYSKDYSKTFALGTTQVVEGKFMKNGTLIYPIRNPEYSTSYALADSILSLFPQWEEYTKALPGEFRYVTYLPMGDYTLSLIYVPDDNSSYFLDDDKIPLVNFTIEPKNIDVIDIKLPGNQTLKDYSEGDIIITTNPKIDLLNWYPEELTIDGVKFNLNEFINLIDLISNHTLNASSSIEGIWNVYVHPNIKGELCISNITNFYKLVGVFSNLEMFYKDIDKITDGNIQNIIEYIFKKFIEGESINSVSLDTKFSNSSIDWGKIQEYLRNNPSVLLNLGFDIFGRYLTAGDHNCTVVLKDYNGIYYLNHTFNFTINKEDVEINVIPVDGVFPFSAGWAIADVSSPNIPEYMMDYYFGVGRTIHDLGQSLVSVMQKVNLKLVPRFVSLNDTENETGMYISYVCMRGATLYNKTLPNNMTKADFKAAQAIIEEEVKETLKNYLLANPRVLFDRLVQVINGTKHVDFNINGDGYTYSSFSPVIYFGKYLNFTKVFLVDALNNETFNWTYVIGGKSIDFKPFVEAYIGNILAINVSTAAVCIDLSHPVAQYPGNYTFNITMNDIDFKYANGVANSTIQRPIANEIIVLDTPVDIEFGDNQVIDLALEFNINQNIEILGIPLSQLADDIYYLYLSGELNNGTWDNITKGIPYIPIFGDGTVHLYVEDGFGETYVFDSHVTRDKQLLREYLYDIVNLLDKEGLGHITSINRPIGSADLIGIIDIVVDVIARNNGTNNTINQTTVNALVEVIVNYLGGMPIASFNLTSKLAPGNYVLSKVVFDGNDYMAPGSAQPYYFRYNDTSVPIKDINWTWLRNNYKSNYTFNIGPGTGKYSKLIASDVEMYYHGNETYVAVLTDLNNNPIVGETVNVTINGVTYSLTTNENGAVSLPIGLNSGVYPVVASYEGIYGYSSVVNNVTVKPTIFGEDITLYYRNGTSYVVTVLDSTGKAVEKGTVVLNIHGVYYTMPVVNGFASLPINLLPGEYIVTAMNPVTGELTSNIVKVLSTIDGNDTVAYRMTGTNYTVYVTDGRGNPLNGVNVTMNIHGVFYNVPVVNGYASLPIYLEIGEYIVTVYNPITGEASSNLVTVVHSIAADNLVMVYKEGSAWNATVVDAYGNPAVNETVCLKINGVVYSGFSDENGVYGIPIDLNPGRYTANAYYGTITNYKDYVTKIISVL